MYEIDQQESAIRFAIKIRNYLIRDSAFLGGPGLIPAESRRRLFNAAMMLETGKVPNEFKRFGPITLAQLKKRYVVYVVEQEETFRAAAKVLDIDPATACRIFNNGRDRDKSADPDPLFGPTPANLLPTND